MGVYIKDHRLFFDEGDGRTATLRQSPNHGGLLGNPAFLLIHFTGGTSAESSASWLCSPDAKASAHIVVSMDGLHVIQLVPFDRIAWHAGVSHWGSLSGLNGHSLGIELDNPGALVKQKDHWYSTAVGKTYLEDVGLWLTHKNEHNPCGWHVYPKEQLNTAFEVGQALIKAYPSINAVLGHDDVAPLRKRDPGPAFPMENFRSRLFGRA